MSYNNNDPIYSVLTDKDPCANTTCAPNWCCETQINGFTSGADCVAFYTNPSGPAWPEEQANFYCNTNVTREYNPATPWIMPCDPYSGCG